MLCGVLLGAVVALALVGLVTVVVGTVVWVGGGADDAPSASTPPPPSGGTAADAAPPRQLRGDELWLGDMDLTGSRVLTPDTALRDVRMSATDVLIGSEGLRAGTLTVDAVVPFEDVADQIGPDAEVERAGSRARLTRTVQVLGRDVRISGTGTVRAQGGQVVVEPTTVEVGAPALVERALGAAVRELVTIRQDVDGLPAELVLRDVTVVEAGFAVTLSGEDVPLG
ncbi:hypothetical protein GCM10027194_21150 [Thalassiella azotivora]